MALKRGLLENGDWIGFAQENESALKDLAEQGISKASIQAQFYYNFVFGETYFPVIDWVSPI